MACSIPSAMASGVASSTTTPNSPSWSRTPPTSVATGTPSAEHRLSQRARQSLAATREHHDVGCEVPRAQLGLWGGTDETNDILEPQLPAPSPQEIFLVRGVIREIEYEVMASAHFHERFQQEVDPLRTDQLADEQEAPGTIRGLRRRLEGKGGGVYAVRDDADLRRRQAGGSCRARPLPGARARRSHRPAPSRIARPEDGPWSSGEA